MSKIYLLKNVYEAAIDRLRFIRDRFERVVVAFSGGKDSTVLLRLAMEVFPELTVYFWDKESNLLSTKDFIQQTFDTLPHKIKSYWFCLPFKMRNALSVYEAYWYCWDETCQGKWIYQPPARPYVVRVENNFLEGHNPEKHNLYHLFAQHVSEQGKYRTAILVGLRTDESLNRYRAVTKHPQLGQGWISKTDAKNCFNAYPVYDWSFGDIFGYCAKKDIPYAPIYDKMFWAGMLKRDMRISQSFCDVSKTGIPVIRQLEPESFRRFLQRVAGINSLTHIDLSKILQKARLIDNFDFLLQLYPASAREQIEKRLERSSVLSGDDEAVVRALLNGDIRFKRVNRTKKVDIKERYKDL